MSLIARTGSLTRRRLVIEVTEERLRELETADAEGRVVVLPCKVGDIVYVLHRRGNTAFITEEAVTSIKITRGRIAYCFGSYSAYETCEGEYRIYFVRAEAEAALEAMKEGTP